MSMSSDGRTLLTAAVDGSVRVWMVDEMERIEEHINEKGSDLKHWQGIKSERSKLDGIQAHFALNQHHQGVRHMAIRNKTGIDLQVVTASSDQSLAVFEFEIPSKIDRWEKA
jgi:hypothetical protein